MTKFLRRRFEVFLISIARKILIDRNVQRSAVVSRCDNKEMWSIAEKLEAIEKRMLSNYE